MDNHWTCEHCGAKIPEGMGHGCVVQRMKMQSEDGRISGINRALYPGRLDMRGAVEEPTLEILEELSALNLVVAQAPPMLMQQHQVDFNQKIIEVLVNAGIVAKNEGWEWGGTTSSGGVVE